MQREEVMNKFILTCLLAIPLIGHGQTFSLLAVYPKVGFLSNSACITKAVVKEFNQSNSDLQIQLTTLDDTQNIKNTYDNAQKIMKLAPDAVIGSEKSSEALVLSKFLNSAKIPFIVPSATLPAIAQNKPYVLPILSSAHYYAYTLAKYMASQKHYRRIAIVRNLSHGYSQYFANATADALKKLTPNIKVKYFDIVDGYEHYTQLVDNILASRPSVIYLPIYTDQISEIVTQLANRQAHVTVYMNGGMTIITESKYFKLISQTAPKLTLFTISIWTGNTHGPYNKDYKHLMNRYCANYAHDFSSANSYDAIKFLTLVLKSNPSLRGLNLIQKAKQFTFPGVTGILKYSKDGYPKRQVVIYQLINGRLTHHNIGAP